MKKAFFLFCFIITSVAFLHAQAPDKSQLEKEREDIRREMDEIQNSYDQVKGQKKETLGQLSLIQRKISLQDRYINVINKELHSIDDDIYLSALEIIRLQHQLDTLKKQYSRSITYAYKNRSNFGYLNFIFSANSFNDALKRIQYLKSYRSFREQQVENIVQTQKAIEQRKVMQISRKVQKNDALKSQAKEMTALEVQKQEKDRVITTLKSKEKDLKKQLADKKKRDVQLKNSMAAVIRREIEEAKRKAKADADAIAKLKAAEDKANAAKKVTTPVVTNPTNNPDNNTTEVVAPRKPAVEAAPKSYLDFSAKDVAVNKSFETSKGRLPWPVDNGFVKIGYGPYVMEGLGVKGVNPGLTIVTPSVGASVKVIWEGEVAGVYNLGDGMAVTIRHGKYFTTYSNLASVSVAKNETVQKGQVIGKAAQEEDGNGGQIDFILMIESKNVNPAVWLHK